MVVMSNQVFLQAMKDKSQLLGKWQWGRSLRPVSVASKTKYPHGMDGMSTYTWMKPKRKQRKNLYLYIVCDIYIFKKPNKLHNTVVESEIL